MSTAHRPTWVAALGGAGLRDGATSAPTHQHSSKDMPGHTRMKYRQVGQDAPEEIRARRQVREDVEGPEEEEDRVDVHVDPDADTDIEENDVFDYGREGEESEDDTEELLRELEKIKREKEEQRAKEAARRDQELLAANPLIDLSAHASGGRETSAFTVKRKWNDDTVFKNQAKGVVEKPKRRFINDTTRSDFHRKFLDKYIR